LNVNAAAVTNALSITGNAGPNVLTGTAFDDTLNGGAGADTLNGASGDDTLVGGNGSDLLTGGGGADAFVFNLAPNASSNKDTITDFTSGTDMLQLSKAVFTAISGRRPHDRAVLVRRRRGCGPRRRRPHHLQPDHRCAVLRRGRQRCWHRDADRAARDVDAPGPGLHGYRADLVRTRRD
jgi:hypothetical protein